MQLCEQWDWRQANGQYILIHRRGFSRTTGFVLLTFEYRAGKPRKVAAGVKASNGGIGRQPAGSCCVPDRAFLRPKDHCFGAPSMAGLGYLAAAGYGVKWRERVNGGKGNGQ
jgi:hypothetical protein